MTMKTLAFAIACLCLSIPLFSQQSGKVRFDSETHDFGSIREENGPVEFRFEFTNTGNAPVLIQAVRASCGCTTPNWTRDPVPPGQKGFVMARYNPQNRPGPFRKSLVVSTNGDPATVTLFIQGMAEGKVLAVEDQYRNKIGDLRLKFRSLNMGKITTEKPAMRSFDIYNDSDRTLAFIERMEKPDYIDISVQPPVLGSRQEGRIVITYDPKGKNDLGFVSDQIVLYTGERDEPRKQLMVVATIEEYFPPMTAEQLSRAPVLSLDRISHDFGTLKATTVKSTELVLTNTGKSELVIRAVKSNCACATTQLDRHTLRPGEQATLVVTFDAGNRRGTEQKSITIFSNDPKAPSQRVMIKAVVGAV